MTIKLASAALLLALAGASAAIAQDAAAPAAAIPSYIAAEAPEQYLAKDRLIPVRSLSRQPYSEELYSIVEACLSLNYLDRPQTAFELQKLLMLEPQDPGKKGLMDSISQPLSKLFQR